MISENGIISIEIVNHGAELKSAIKSELSG